MSNFLDILTTLFQPIGVAFTMIYFYGLFARHSMKDKALNTMMGLMMGLAAGISMSTPIAFSEGFLIDARLVFVAISFGLFGWTAGTITFGMAAIIRLQHGGDGVILGIIALLITAVLSLGWRYLLKDKIASDVKGLMILGMMVNAHMVVGFLLPQALYATYFLQTGPFIVVIHTAGVVLLGLLLSREKLLQNEARSLRAAAETDALTGTLNRRSTRELVDSLNAATGEPQGRAVMLFDIDHFKGINDTYGHPVGDAILMAFSERLRDCLRSGDLFSRLGGDEFSIVLPDTSERVARAVAERCRAAIGGDPFTVHGRSLDVSTSVGVTWSPVQPSFDEHTATADTALYDAKRKGRNQVCVGSPLVNTSPNRAQSSRQFHTAA